MMDMERKPGGFPALTQTTTLHLALSNGGRGAKSLCITAGLGLSLCEKGAFGKVLLPFARGQLVGTRFPPANMG